MAHGLEAFAVVTGLIYVVLIPPQSLGMGGRRPEFSVYVFIAARPHASSAGLLRNHGGVRCAEAENAELKR